MASTRKKSQTESYVEGIGRRKTAIARVRITAEGKSFTVEGKDYQAYFKTDSLRRLAAAALECLNLQNAIGISAHVSGGGIRAQAAAVRHGVARALVLHNGEYKKALRDAGFLTRDPRMKERRKFGLKKARRAPQWSKR